MGVQLTSGSSSNTISYKTINTGAVDIITDAFTFKTATAVYQAGEVVKRNTDGQLEKITAAADTPYAIVYSEVDATDGAAQGVVLLFGQVPAASVVYPVGARTNFEATLRQNGIYIKQS